MTREDRSVSPTTHLLRNTINGNDIVIRKVLADFSDLLIFSRLTPVPVGNLIRLASEAELRNVS
jgi:hypothetical protein